MSAQANFPKLHNAMWPGLVGKGPDSEPPIDLDTMISLTVNAEVDGVKFDGIDIFLIDPHTSIDATDDEIKALGERATGIQARLADLLVEREGLAAPVDPDALDLYNRMFAKKSDAVVPVAHDVCGGCHVKVVSSIIQSLRQDSGITQCDGCGRIVYLVE